MHNVVQVVGGLAVLCGIAMLAFGVYGAATGNSLVLAGMIWTALPVIAGGAAFYCLGAMVEHLIAIRKNMERQLAIFEARLGKKD